MCNILLYLQIRIFVYFLWQVLKRKPECTVFVDNLNILLKKVILSLCINVQLIKLINVKHICRNVMIQFVMGNVSFPYIFSPRFTKCYNEAHLSNKIEHLLTKPQRSLRRRLVSQWNQKCTWVSSSYILLWCASCEIFLIFNVSLIIMAITF